MYKPDLGTIITHNCYQRLLEPIEDLTPGCILTSPETFYSLSVLRKRVVGSLPAFLEVRVRLPESTEREYRTQWYTAFAEPSDAVQSVRPSSKENVITSSCWMEHYGVEEGDPIYVRPSAPAPIVGLRIM